MLSKIFHYMTRHLRLAPYIDHPGDGRQSPQIPARTLLRALLAGRFLRENSHHAIEQLVENCKLNSLPGVRQRFSDDTLDYLIERLDPSVTRHALADTLRHAKRMKAFDAVFRIGLAIDGTHAGRSNQQHCALCRPHRDAEGNIFSYDHQVAAISVVGTGLTLPFDVEPYGPGDSEYAAGQRLLHRAITMIGKRFAQYLVVDGEYATAPFLHAATREGIAVLARVKENLPTLSLAVEQRFRLMEPTLVLKGAKECVEMWDAGDFPPWERLEWSSVRVLRYRRILPDRTIVQADWLTNISKKVAGSEALYHMARSRWEIENQCFNDVKTRYGFEHICHHEENSIVISWLLTFLAVTVERLFRLRFMHRGNRDCISANEMCTRFWYGVESRNGRRDAVSWDSS